MWAAVLIVTNLVTVVRMTRDGESSFDIVSVVVVASIVLTAIVWLYDAFGYHGTRRMRRR